jgi:cysteinyl-tRNA synthetase
VRAACLPCGAPWAACGVLRCRRDTATMTAPEMTASLRIGGSYLPVLDRARIYCCGITPYDVTHLGHAATFVWVDVLARVLGASGVNAQLCRNVTDVDDVLFAAAERDGSAFDAFASVQQFRFDQDMTALNVREPQFEPRARRNIGQVIRLAAGLIESGAAYLRDGSVYFRGAGTAADAGLSNDEALALAAEYGARLDDPAKDDKLDVAVWRSSAAGEPGWPSPWGTGRPGWHAECAAMSISVLGLAVDVLCGGADLRYPHHAYQAAMAQAISGVRPFARARFNVGVVRLDGAKMAKSTGNLVLVTDVLAGHPAAALRLCLLDRPWAAGWDYSVDQLEAATARLERLYRAAGRNAGASAQDAAQTAAAAAITGALHDDLDVPAALAVAEEVGGAAARSLIATLGLSETS